MRLALEYGHSDQAPNGIVRVSARNALRDLKKLSGVYNESSTN